MTNTLRKFKNIKLRSKEQLQNVFTMTPVTPRSCFKYLNNTIFLKKKTNSFSQYLHVIDNGDCFRKLKNLNISLNRK